MENFEAKLNKLNKIAWQRSSLKRRKKILPKKIKFIGGIFLVVLVLAGVFFFSPIFKIKKIDILATEITFNNFEITPIKLLINSYITGNYSFLKNNILLIDINELIKNIKIKFPFIEEIKIKKIFWKRTILVELVGKKIFALWCPDYSFISLIFIEADSHPCFYIDQNGVIFQEAPLIEGSLMLLIKSQKNFDNLQIGQKVIQENILNFVSKIKENLFSSVGINIKEILIKNNNTDIEVFTIEGFKIFFDSQKDLQKQIANLKIVLEEKIKKESAPLDYIDLREGNRIYYKLKE